MKVILFGATGMVGTGVLLGCLTETLARLNPEMIFCYVSGAGTDSAERGRQMWARLKRVFPDQLTMTETVGRAMIEAAPEGVDKQVMGSREINVLATRATRAES